MFRSFIAIVAVLVIPAAAFGCNPVQAISYGVAAPLVQQQVVYQPVVAQVQAVQVQQVAYAAPVVQQVVVKQQRVRRHPIRRAAQIVLPPYGCR